MNKNTINELPETLISEKGVNALSVRPNASAAYGVSGLSSNQLKEWFDQVPFALKEKINEIIGIVNDGNLSQYIPTGYTSIETLADIFGAIGNGDFSEILMAYKGDGKTLASLHDILVEIYKELQALDNLPTDVDGTRFTVMEYLGIIEDRLRTEMKSPQGKVSENDPLPVSGSEVFNAIKEGFPDADELKSKVNLLHDIVSHTEKVVEKNEKRIAVLEMANEGNTYAFTPYSDIKYKHPVPATALPYARLDSIGGYTRRSKNLLKLVYDPKNIDENGNTPLHTEYVNGATYAVDPNGYLCINGEGDISGGLTLDVSKMLVSQPSTVTVSAKYISGTAEADQYGNTPSVSTPYMEMRQAENTSYSRTVENFSLNDFSIMAVGNFKDYKLAVMYEEGTTASEFEPYFEGLKSAKVTMVKSYGKNLYHGLPEYTLDGTFYEGKTGAITKFEGGLKAPLTFSYKREGISANIATLFRIVHMDGTETAVGPVTYSLNVTKDIKYIHMVNWCSCNGRVYDIQLERGSKATEYKPYSATPIDTYDVPPFVQSLEGYGLGVPSAYNYFDESTKRFGKRLVEVVLTGKEAVYSYEFQGLNGVSITVLDSTYTRSKGVCSHGNVVTNSLAVSGNMWIGVSNSNVYWLGIMDLLGFAPTNLTKFKEYLAEQYANGTPVRIIYVTKNAESMSYDHVDGVDGNPVYLNVEANGYIVGVNDGIESNLGITFQEKL